MLRKIGGVIVGLIVAIAIVQVAEFGVHMMYPPPAGTDMHDFAQIKKFVATLPLAALALVLVGWLIGTLAGTLLAARIGLSAVPGYVVGAFLLAGGIVNSVVIPQPVWFSAVSFVIYIAMTITGTKLGRPAVSR